MRICSGDDCLRRAQRGGLCWTHWKRRHLGKPEPETASPLERVIIAANGLAEAEEDEDYKAALERLRYACAGWLRQLGWRPPP